MSAKDTCAKMMAAALLVAMAVAGPAAANSIGIGDGSFLEAAPILRDIQETIWFQGYLADDGTGDPIDATYAMTARMYDADVGGATVWGPETHVAVVISNGWFNIELGSIIGGLPQFDAPPYYLQLNVNGELLNPRLKLGSVPSAFQALGADDGLNLPYSGTWGSTGTAFSVTTTGTGVAGYFRVNNAGSSAGAVYGRHSGTGAAVMAWHDGVGPAVRAVANGTGLAGEFEGAVAVSESLVAEGLIKGRSLLAQHSVAAQGTLFCTGLWVADSGAEPGYVLQAIDDWGVARWAPPNVIDRHNEGAITTIGATATQYDDAAVTLTVPGPGYITVASSVQVYLNHTTGILDELFVSHSTSPTDLGGNNAQFAYFIPAAYPTSASNMITCAVQSTHEVATAGTYTYYLVGRMATGQDASDVFWYGQMTGIYYPHPIPVKSSETDREEQAREAYQRN